MLSNLALAAVVAVAPQREAWERAIVVQLDEAADLRAAVWEAHEFGDACFGPVSTVRHPLRPTEATVRAKVVPVLVLLAESDPEPAIRAAAVAARATLEAEVWCPDPAAALAQLGWTPDALDLAQLERALHAPAEPSHDSSDVLLHLQIVSRLLGADPLRIELASRLARESDETKRHSNAHLFAIGAAATASSHEVDVALRRVLFSALDSDADAAQIARLALARCAARPGPGTNKLPSVDELERDSRRELRERFDDSNAARRRATWLAAAWLERGRVQAREAPDEELRVELRAFFANADEPLDVAALSLSLAILKDTPSRLAIRRRFLSAAPRASAYVALALALHDGWDAADSGLAVEAWSKTLQRPAERLDAALALALLGDKSEVNTWIEALPTAESESISHLARALAAVGDLRAVDPLLAALQDKRFSTASRLELLRALVAVCDPNASARRLSRYFTGLARCTEPEQILPANRAAPRAARLAGRICSGSVHRARRAPCRGSGGTGARCRAGPGRLRGGTAR
jgi:hypothetical protein